MSDQQRLLELYRKFPCRTLPNAFWKTSSRLKGGSLDIQYNAEGELKRLSIWHNNECLALWLRSAVEEDISSVNVDSLDFVLVHNDSSAVFTEVSLSRRQPFFRLRHDGPVKRHLPPPGFLFRDARPKAEVEDIVKIIQRCYTNMKVTPTIVREWQAHPVYAPDLWVWIVDAESERNAGLGIAELDPQVPEASLEWIQVLPEYRNQGLGSAIVAELLHRVEGKVRFTTVSGEVDNPNEPERLYRKCGFTGSDIWWLLVP